MIAFLFEINQIDKVYIFSGIIRNYFLGINDIRDIDIMVDTSKDLSLIINKYEHKRNSFGGYKLSVGGMNVDLWYLRQTWGLNNPQIVMQIDLDKYIPNTAFFNFSSILFSFEDNCFIYSKHFLRFLRDKKIDYVFKHNANYALCVVNSFYYQSKLNLPLSDHLKSFLIKLNKSLAHDYENVQLKHFGRIIYSNQEIQTEFKKMANNNKPISNAKSKLKEK